MYLTQHAAKFRHRRQPDKQGDLQAAERGDKGERQIQRGIGGDIGDLVQIAAQCRLLTELARQHPIHRVQRHADKQPHGQQPKQSRNLRTERQQQPDRDRHCAGRQCNLIGGYTAVIKRAHQRAQQVLEFGFEGVNTHDGGRLKIKNKEPRL